MHVLKAKTFLSMFIVCTNYLQTVPFLGLFFQPNVASRHCLRMSGEEGGGGGGTHWEGSGTRRVVRQRTRVHAALLTRKGGYVMFN